MGLLLDLVTDPLHLRLERQSCSSEPVQTMKYWSSFPSRFGSAEDGRLFCCGFFDYYNFHHRHSGIGHDTGRRSYGRAEQRHHRSAPDPSRSSTGSSGTLTVKWHDRYTNRGRLRGRDSRPRNVLHDARPKAPHWFLSKSIGRAIKTDTFTRSVRLGDSARSPLVDAEAAAQLFRAKPTSWFWMLIRSLWSERFDRELGRASSSNGARRR